MPVERQVTLHGRAFVILQHDDGTFELPEELARLRGQGTALKPSFEPVLVFRKPLSEKTVAANVLEHGAGGLNIDGWVMLTVTAWATGMVVRTLIPHIPQAGGRPTLCSAIRPIVCRLGRSKCRGTNAEANVHRTLKIASSNRMAEACRRVGQGAQRETLQG
jgi:hypothetical protein